MKSPESSLIQEHAVRREFIASSSRVHRVGLRGARKIRGSKFPGKTEISRNGVARRWHADRSGDVSRLNPTHVYIHINIYWRGPPCRSPSFDFDVNSIRICIYTVIQSFLKRTVKKRKKVVNIRRRQHFNYGKRRCNGNTKIMISGTER